MLRCSGVTADTASGSPPWGLTRDRYVASATSPPSALALHLQHVVPRGSVENTRSSRYPAPSRGRTAQSEAITMHRRIDERHHPAVQRRSRSRGRITARSAPPSRPRTVTVSSPRRRSTSRSPRPMRAAPTVGRSGFEQRQPLLGQCERRPPIPADSCGQHEIDVGQPSLMPKCEPRVAPIVLQQAARGTQP